MQKLSTALKKHLLDLFEKKKSEISKTIQDKQQKIIAQYKILDAESSRLRDREKQLDKKIKIVIQENKKIRGRIGEIKKLVKEFVNEIGLDGIDEIREGFVKKIELLDDDKEMNLWVEKLFK